MSIFVGLAHSILFLISIGIYWYVMPEWHSLVKDPFLELVLSIEWLPQKPLVIDLLFIVLFSIDFFIPALLSAFVVYFVSNKIKPYAKIKLLYAVLTSFVLVFSFDYFANFIPKFTGSYIEYIWYIVLPSTLLVWVYRKPNK